MPTAIPERYTLLYTVNEAAARLTVTPRAVEDFCRRGELDSLFLGQGRMRRISADAIEAFIAAKGGQR